MALLPMLFLESLLRPHSMAVSSVRSAALGKSPCCSVVARQKGPRFKWQRRQTEATALIQSRPIRSDQIRSDRRPPHPPPTTRPWCLRPFRRENPDPATLPRSVPYSNLLTRIKKALFSPPKSPDVSLQRAACLREIHSTAGAEQEQSRSSGSRPLPPISPWFHFLSYSY